MRLLAVLLTRLARLLAVLAGCCLLPRLFALVRLAGCCVAGILEAIGAFGLHDIEGV